MHYLSIPKDGSRSKKQSISRITLFINSLQTEADRRANQFKSIINLSFPVIVKFSTIKLEIEADREAVNTVIKRNQLLTNRE